MSQLELIYLSTQKKRNAQESATTTQHDNSTQIRPPPHLTTTRAR